MFWIYVLSFQKRIVLNSINYVFDTCIVFWVDVSCFRQMYFAFNICVVFWIYVLYFIYMYCDLDTCIMF